MAEPDGSFRLLGNSAWNAAAFVIGVGLNLVILPFVVFRLGLAAFGIAGLVTACLAPALAFSNALALSTARELAHRLAPAERDDARRFFATALLLAVGIGGLIVIGFAVAGPPLARLAFRMSADSANDLGRAFVLGALGWLCQCLSAVFLALFTARQDYRRISLVNISSAIVATGSMVVLIPSQPWASTFLGCQALGFATGLLVVFVLSRLRLGEWLARPALHRGPLGDLVNVGSWQLAAQGGGLLSGQADRYLLGALLQPQFVGFFTIAQRLEEAMYIGILKVGEILFPYFSALQRESSDRKAELLFRSSWILNVLAASALGALVPVAGPLLYQWTGAEVAAEAQRVLVVLAIAGMLGCSANVFAFYLLAHGRSRSIALISLVTAVFTVATSAIALPYFGWQAAGWSACAGMTAQIITTILLLRRSFSIAGIWSRVAHFVLLPLGTGIATALALRFALRDALFDQMPHWWYVGVLYGVAASVIFVVVVIASRVGPHGAVCWRDLRVIVNRFLPVKAT
ncbi:MULTISPECIES: oligosaccharide flippase family protein [unclassified Bradyrhizobium]|uniref:oligosaccharide flippase family protein n=1 Tax=unclassified Bradyrhizobium TaxID=2631580 RepID=UPI001FF930D5|nr:MULTISPECIES: oligosaccharide flippase family protein [unclassified Bradyrhizobium]MCK1271808.1 oligosaccharide flippase family protein [Bradyrhizobium sp. 84]MCK1369850.1 oligosaccharide flippase family protein [Bradyrhizobium sp. 49]MCK1614340.1 oligosaccharide flippase family protein [Bradyrhizobium sp. 163]MCK1765628.1 oligosaccharide flippase family protein [Bradyrhizobium sp. 136]